MLENLKANFVLLDMRPFSINKTYSTGRGRGFFKTNEAEEWCSQLFNRLSTKENQEQLQLLREAFDHKKHGLSFSITISYPYAEFYRKAGGISSKTQDISNFEKIILDCFCLPKFHELGFPYGCPNLNVDDKYVVDLTSSKRPTVGAPWINVFIRIVDLPTLEEKIPANL